jgi:hypothetical protein
VRRLGRRTCCHRGSRVFGPPKKNGCHNKGDDHYDGASNPQPSTSLLRATGIHLRRLAKDRENCAHDYGEGGEHSERNA